MPAALRRCIELLLSAGGVTAMDRKTMENYLESRNGLGFCLNLFFAPTGN